MQSNKKTHIYDYAVIGSGIVGLSVATALSQISDNVILLEGGDVACGLSRGIKTPVGPSNNGLRFLPNSESAQKALQFLSALLGQTISAEVVDAPPVTYEAGGIKPFVGFGDLQPEFYDQISYYLSQGFLRPSLEVHEWAQGLAANYKGQFSPRSFVTKIHVTEGLATSLTINGQKNIQAANVIYCGSVKDLRPLLEEGVLSARALQKLAKNQYWTSINLDLLHGKPVTENPALHVLNGTTQDEIGPCVGQFETPQIFGDKQVQFSQWTTFIDNDEAEDTEKIGAALKKIKRQIKRAFPEATENLEFERILVVPSMAGNGDLKLNGNQTLPNVPNLWIASAQMSSQKNLLGGLLQAELVCSALGCHPTGAQIEIATPEETPAEGIEA